MELLRRGLILSFKGGCGENPARDVEGFEYVVIVLIFHQMTLYPIKLAWPSYRIR